MNDFIFVYLPTPSEEVAKKITRHLMIRRLIACANIFPIKSIYRWKGKIKDETEYVLLAKTLDKHFGRIKREVETIHPYEIPCIAKIPVSSNLKYLEWLKGEVRI